MKGLTYKEAGVSIDEGDRFVSLIAPLVRKSFRKEVITDIGFFGALFKLDLSRYKEPVLVSGTDGVGTKLKIAFMADKHDSVGIDLVAMCVNDILTSGAEPLFFLDYLATGRLVAEKAVKVVEGIVQGCTEAGCALIGGETAEMPGFYKEDEYDLAGFSVGIVEKKDIIDGSGIASGDIIIGISSNGLHSNGFSLVRKIFFELYNFSLSNHIPELGKTLGDELLRPTRIYVRAINTLKENQIPIKGLAHITGGGITGNLRRILPDGLSAIVRKDTWPEQPIFGLIKDLGKIPNDEMMRTFNMGIGYIVVLSEEYTEKTISTLKGKGFESFIIGRIEKGKREVRYEQG